MVIIMVGGNNVRNRDSSDELAAEIEAIATTVDHRFCGSKGMFLQACTLNSLKDKKTSMFIGTYTDGDWDMFRRPRLFLTPLSAYWDKHGFEVVDQKPFKDCLLLRDVDAKLFQFVKNGFRCRVKTPWKLCGRFALYRYVGVLTYC